MSCSTSSLVSPTATQPGTSGEYAPYEFSPFSMMTKILAISILFLYWACLKTLSNVPTGMSFPGCPETVTIPFFAGCLFGFLFMTTSQLIWPLILSPLQKSQLKRSLVSDACGDGIGRETTILRFSARYRHHNYPYDSFLTRRSL